MKCPKDTNLTLSDLERKNLSEVSHEKKSQNTQPDIPGPNILNPAFRLWSPPNNLIKIAAPQSGLWSGFHF